MDFIRHGAKTQNVPIEDMENYICDEQSLEKSYITEESKLALHKALAKLAEDYRIILWLVYFENFTSDEAAAIMKKNKRQVRNLLYRAKQALKSTLEKEGFSYEEF